MPDVDITDKIGYTLLKKGIIDYETLEKSLRVKESESNKKERRNLGQILVNEFNADHDAVFREVANLYAFREIYLADEVVDKTRIEFIRKLVDGLQESYRDLLFQSKVSDAFDFNIDAAWVGKGNRFRLAIAWKFTGDKKFNESAKELEKLQQTLQTLSNQSNSGVEKKK